jgi:aspartyl-tRNA(Asn)/glutamyl-tRNA(Gln) amidotransferase subunit A
VDFTAAGMSDDPAELGILEAAAALRSRELSSVELTEACLRRIDERNSGAPTHDGAPDAINAFVRLYPDRALEHARSADERLARERDAGPIVCGIPIAIKDLYAIDGLPLTASSRVLEGNIATTDATAWARLRDQGSVPIGHTHTHEFAFGGTTDQVGNPWALERVAGGSSGGNAAALAARMVPAALGTDTCGSLRIPSACCGTSTVKPTHGLVPLHGVVPLAPTLDHPGPMARTIADAAALLEALAVGGAEPTPLMPPPASLADLPQAAQPGPKPLEGVAIALSDRASDMPVDDEVASGFEHARSACDQLGARVVELASPWSLNWDDLTSVLLTEVWEYHRAHADRHDRYRPAIAEGIEAARNFTSAIPYIEAQRRRAQGTAAWEDWFKANRIDFVLEPTLPIVPYARGSGYERGHAGGAGDPLIALTALWDMTGMPVASLPVGPHVGVSLIAPRGREASLIQAAIDLQEHALPTPVWTAPSGRLAPSPRGGAGR